MTLSSAQLDLYFDRIAWAGPRAPNLATLHAIMAGHAARIPFENADPLLKRRVDLDSDALLAKLVERRRGGYCFEQNMLLMQVLVALGFDVIGLAARVLWGRPDDSPGPRTHMLLRVALPEGAFLADVGFGGLTLTAPLKFEVGPEQATPHEPHRLVAFGEETELQAKLGTEWTRLYHFTMQPQLPIDYAVANWFTATYPDGLFTNNLLCARPDPDRRYALFNDAFTIHHRDGRKEQRRLHGADELGETLARHFQLSLSADEIAAIAAVIGRAA